MERSPEKYFVPTTMDELMARFEINMKRNGHKEQLN